jgi:hypothetical protein
MYDNDVINRPKKIWLTKKLIIKSDRQRWTNDTDKLEVKKLDVDTTDMNILRTKYGGNKSEMMEIMRKKRKIGVRENI